MGKFSGYQFIHEGNSVRECPIKQKLGLKNIGMPLYSKRNMKLDFAN